MRYILIRTIAQMRQYCYIAQKNYKFVSNAPKLGAKIDKTSIKAISENTSSR